MSEFVSSPLSYGNSLASLATVIYTLTGAVIVSRTVTVESPVYDYYGVYILEDEQLCPAREDGRCCYL